MKKFLAPFLGIVFFALIFGTLPIMKTAADIEFKNPSKLKDLMEVVDAIIKFLSYVAIPLTILMTVIAAFLFLTSGGAPQRITTAKNVLFYALLGLLIIILAKAIVSIVNYVLG